MPDVSIIIVSWNVRALLDDCLKSIYASDGIAPTSNPSHFTLEVIVVDSASHDGSDQLLKDRYPQVKALLMQENVGFAKGNNLGLQQAQGRYVFLLNPDTRLSPTLIKDCVAYMDTSPTVGIVGPHTLNEDGTTQSSRRRFPTFLTGMFESTWLQKVAPRRIMDHYYVRDQADDAVVDVDWVQGSAVFARHEVYEQVGGLDEAYIMYSEELDWCRRAKDAGWRVVYLGTTDLVHLGGKSSEQVVTKTHIRFQQSKLRYFKKFHGVFQAQLLRVILLLNYAWQWLTEAVKYLLGHKRELRRQRMQTYADVLRSGLKVE